MKKLILALALLAVSALACANTEQCYYYNEPIFGDPSYEFIDETSWLDSLLGYPCGELTAMSSFSGFSDGDIKDIYGYQIECADKTIIVVTADEVEVGYEPRFRHFITTSSKKTTKAFKTCRRAVAKFMKRIKENHTNNSAWDG